MPGLRQRYQHPIPQVRRQAEIVDVDAVIGNMTAQSLNLLKLNWTLLLRVTANLCFKLYDVRGKPHPFPLTKENLLEKYQDLFTGVGCFPGPSYHIETKPSVSPGQHNAPPPSPRRQVRVQLQSAYREELEPLRLADILKQVHNEYTPWVNSTVVKRTPNGTIRLSLDSRDLNGATQRTHYYVRTIDDVIRQYPMGKVQMEKATMWTSLQWRCSKRK